MKNALNVSITSAHKIIQNNIQYLPAHVPWTSVQVDISILPSQNWSFSGFDDLCCEMHWHSARPSSEDQYSSVFVDRVFDDCAWLLFDHKIAKRFDPLLFTILNDSFWMYWSLSIQHLFDILFAGAGRVQLKISSWTSVQSIHHQPIYPSTNTPWPTHNLQTRRNHKANNVNSY